MIFQGAQKPASAVAEFFKLPRLYRRSRLGRVRPPGRNERIDGYDFRIRRGCLFGGREGGFGRTGGAAVNDSRMRHLHACAKRHGLRPDFALQLATEWCGRVSEMPDSSPWKRFVYDVDAWCWTPDALAEAGNVEDELQWQIKAVSTGLLEKVEVTERDLREEAKGVEERLRQEITAINTEIREQRASTNAQLGAHGQAFGRIEQRFERLSAEHRTRIRWIIGSAIALGALMVSLGGLMVNMLQFVQTGGG